jgi:DNA polymerase (family 10)
VQAQVSIRILTGTEADILEDGSLDVPEDAIDRLDVVIASVHARHRLDAERMTARLVRAMSHGAFKIWGHALGRLLGEREPFACDVPAVLDAIATHRAAIEVNGDPRRLDLEPKWIREARKRNIPFVISSDAHSVRGLEMIRWGVITARRGGVRRSEVLNTLSAEAFAARVAPR